ncbi:hypothetical protein ABID14_001110 [Peptoniphilus olsenii]|uniref:DUF6440 domain-containing protein n=1 Tax=Peptoniphilus olsenii TaxID=411570 RepID=A0ABV2JCI6_9FIRM
MFGKEKYKRFIVANKYSLGFENIKIIVDIETGVNYLEIYSSYGNSLTPLLNSEGSVVISSPQELNSLKNKND